MSVVLDNSKGQRSPSTEDDDIAPASKSAKIHCSQSEHVKLLDQDDEKCAVQTEATEESNNAAKLKVSNIAKDKENSQSSSATILCQSDVCDGDLKLVETEAKRPSDGADKPHDLQCGDQLEEEDNIEAMSVVSESVQGASEPPLIHQRDHHTDSTNITDALMIGGVADNIMETTQEENKVLPDQEAKDTVNVDGTETDPLKSYVADSSGPDEEMSNSREVAGTI